MWRISIRPAPPAARADQQPRRRRPDSSARSGTTGLLRITLRRVLIVEGTIFSKPMEQATEERYRDQVQRVFNRISLTGLPERDPGLSELPLDRVFISLSVEVRRVVTDLRFRLVEADRPDGASAPDGGHPEELRRGDRLSLGSPPAPESSKLSVGQALSQYRWLIIVGDPGSGKTTLLRWLAVTFAAARQADADRPGPTFTEPCLPILLELRRFAERVREARRAAIGFRPRRRNQQLIAQTRALPGATGSDAGGNSGRGLLILLDGLDEIEDRQARTRLVEAIEALYLDPRSNASNNLCLLTTRPHGFAIFRLATGFRPARFGHLAVMTSPPSSAIGIASPMASTPSLARRTSWSMRSVRMNGSRGWRQTRYYAQLLLLYFGTTGFCRIAASNFISNVAKRCSTPGNATRT